MADATTGPPVVTRAQLQDIAVNLFVVRRVPDLMRHYFMTPESTTPGDESTVMTYANIVNPGSDLFYMFRSFDSAFHEGERNQKTFSFLEPGAPLRMALGTELNYFFEGTLFRAFALPTTRMWSFIGGWKRATGHGDVNPNVRYFALIGWQDLPGLWPRILEAEKAQKQQEARFAEFERRKRHEAAVKYRIYDLPSGSKL